MRGHGAAARHAREPEPEPEPEQDITAALRRVIAGAGTAVDRMRRQERELDAELARLRAVAAGGDAGRLAAAVDELSKVTSLLLVEVISCAAHNAEAREAAEECSALLRRKLEKDLLGEAMRDAGIMIGYQRRVEEEQQEAAQRALPPASHRAPRRGGHLRLAAPAVRTATALGVAASFAAGTVATTIVQDSASVGYAATGSAHHSAPHFTGPDTAVPVSVPRLSWSPRPSVAAKSAKPAPRVTPAVPVRSASAPSLSPPPPAPAPAPPPALLVSVRDLHLSGTSGTFTLTATTQEGVDWSVTTDIPGASLDVRQGILSSGQQPVTVTLRNPEGLAGTVFIRYGSQGIATIWVTP